MIRRILVPLDPSPYTETALKLGCAAAKQHGAELTGLVVLDIPEIERSVGPVPVGASHYAEQLEEHREKEAQERIHFLLSRFKEKCEKEGVAHRECEHQGSPAEWIIKESIFYDLVITGLRTFFHFETSDGPGDSLEKILDHAITPVCGVPEEFSTSRVSQEKLRVLVAFDGSLPSARALHRFASLADPDLTEVRLLMSSPEQETANYYMDQAEVYLNSHNIHAVGKEWTSQEIIPAVDEQCMDWAQMVVVGAHAKQGLLDFFVGSLTRHLIDAEWAPVLIG